MRHEQRRDEVELSTTAQPVPRNGGLREWVWICGGRREQRLCRVEHLQVTIALYSPSLNSTKMINGIVCNEAKAKLLYHLARLPISCMSVMIVRDVMNRKIVSIDSEKPVIEVVKLMVAKDIGSIAVMAGKKYVGIVTERDILKKVTLQSSDAGRVKVDEMM